MMQNSLYNGNILENFVVSELKKQATWSTISVQLYYLRTPSGTEIDIILESRSGSIVGIKIKNSSRVTKDNFKGLTLLKNKLPKKLKKGIVLYTGNQCIPFGENLFALPINALWEHDICR